MSELNVDIITAEKSLVEGRSASSLTAPGIEGEFEVLPGHTTFLTELNPGPLLLSGSDGPQRFVVSGGFAEVMQGHVRILADQAEPVEALKLDQVQAALKDVTERLAAADPYSAEAETLRAKQRYLEIQQDLL